MIVEHSRGRFNTVVGIDSDGADSGLNDVGQRKHDLLSRQSISFISSLIACQRKHALGFRSNRLQLTSGQDVY